MKDKLWSVGSWREFPISQQPDWPDKNKLRNATDELRTLPALVFSEETRNLKNDLRNVNKEKSFILQAGDCSESFSDCNGPKIHNYLRIMLQMSAILSLSSKKNIVKIGRIAGQYAKPRTSDFEVVNGEKIPCYRGDMVNDYEPTRQARTPDPYRLLEAYFRSAASLNLVRAFTQGGYTQIQNFSDWKHHFFSGVVSESDDFVEFEKKLNFYLADKGLPLDRALKNDIIYTSHEALILDYEEAFVRVDTIKGVYYSTSAHMLWIGDRTRDVGKAHVEFARGIGNPIGVKIGPTCDPDELISIINLLNPENEEGKIVLICRLGKNNIETNLPTIIKAVSKADLNVLWVCDPMHGNTFVYNNYKVRSFNNVVDETKLFFGICYSEGVVPGGIHLEITPDNVTECVGGKCGLSFSDLEKQYNAKVDPRFNAAQALEFAFILSELIH